MPPHPCLLFGLVHQFICGPDGFFRRTSKSRNVTTPMQVGPPPIRIESLLQFAASLEVTYWAPLLVVFGENQREPVPSKPRCSR